MKTKEIEVWVDQAVLVDGTLEAFYTIATNQKDADEYEFPTIKARLTIEIPEQKVKVELTESQAEAVWGEPCSVDDFKKALGFKVGDE